MPKHRQARPGPANSDAIRQALSLHQRGQLADAERLYTGILAAEPDHFDALHFLGVLRHQQGRSIEALKLIAAALKRNAASADALSNYGVVLVALRRHEEAVAAYDRALAIRPDQADALSNRGGALNSMGRSEAALASCEAALAINPAHADARSNRASALLALGRHAEALTGFDQALMLRPDHVDALEGRAAALNELGRADEALRSLDRALVLAPAHVPSLARRGSVLAALGRYPEALTSFDSALALDPRLPSTLNNRGQVLLALARLDDALASFEAALSEDPKCLEAMNNIGNVLAALDRHEEAERWYRNALALAPDRAEAKWNLGLFDLSLGRFGEGWELFEQRWVGGVKELQPRPYPQPKWTGGKIERALLVWGEQGLGDQIIYSSIVPDLFAVAGSVVLEVDPRLVPLFARSFPKARVVGREPALYGGDVEAQVPVGSLGRFLRPSFDAFPRRDHGYLIADPSRTAKLRERLTRDGHSVIGLSWRSIAPLIGRSKTAQLRDFAAVLRLPGCRFIDLQYGDTRADCAAVERELGIRIEHPDDIDNTNDIDGLAALMSACDVVVTVSNTTAHLAGALGRPTWVFLPFGNARIWYWFKERSDSPWYPQARIRRQANVQPWGDLISSAAGEICSFVSKA